MLLQEGALLLLLTLQRLLECPQVISMLKLMELQLSVYLGYCLALVQ
jgi:hypothetical protein